MATQTIIADPPTGTPGDKGVRNDACLKELFPGEKPIEKIAKTAAAYKIYFIKTVINGDLIDKKLIGYYGFPDESKISMDFSDAPNMNDVKSGGGGGEPATPYVPNPTSPGAGSIAATNQLPAPAFTKAMKAKEDAANVTKENPSVESAAMKTPSGDEEKALFLTMGSSIASIKKSKK